MRIAAAGRHLDAPVSAQAIDAGVVQPDKGCALASGMLAAHVVVIRGDFSDERSRLLDGKEFGNHPDGARSVWHINDRCLIVGGNLDRGMRPARGRATDQERYGKALALHLGSDMRHFLERGGDQP